MGLVLCIRRKLAMHCVRLILGMLIVLERPIAVEAYGAVTNLGTAYRKPTEKKDFYTLFDKFGTGETIGENEAHYVMAMLVRGGVFGQSSK